MKLDQLNVIQILAVSQARRIDASGTCDHDIRGGSRSCEASCPSKRWRLEAAPARVDERIAAALAAVEDGGEVGYSGVGEGGVEVNR